MLVTGAFVFLPQFLLAVFSVLDFRSGNSLRILYRQPSLLLLPTFTCFTFSRVSSSYRGQADNRVVFSKRMTIANMVLTAAGTVACVIYIQIIDFSDHSDHIEFLYRMPYVFLIALIFALILVCPGTIATLLFLFNDKMSGCCCNCWTAPPLEEVAYDPERPETLIVLNKGSSQAN